ncbi:NADH dehydrogenase [ubiquinone] iron-sulfur protein 5-B-like [Bidens hawaiensis]|uniref:NADH dehydrogenase [ubiquinone] iron-sulfur protein 5-B-like n=1 Tax=Bidens hawaiensis TaxID=980011 RepID=UPI0040496038
MASGWGITGNKGRCYDFWMDFSECMSRCREPKDCSLLREDYLETTPKSCCILPMSDGISILKLISKEKFQRRNRIYKEEQRQIRAAAEKAKGGDGDGVPHH